jgi:glutaminase
VVSNKVTLKIIDNANFINSQREADQKNVEDVLFDMFVMDNGLLPMGRFLAALRTTGIRRTDPRINEMMENLRKVHKTNSYEGGSPETLNLNRETFKA